MAGYLGTKAVLLSTTAADVVGNAEIGGDLTVGGSLSVDGGTIKLDGNYPVGTGNVALGNTALDSVTTGEYNTAIGDVSLTSNTDGVSNTSVGAFSLEDNIGGDYNTASGALAVRRNTTGNQNTGSGYASLLANTTGSSNSAFGASALQNNTTASYNTAVGYQAGYSNTTGTQNTALGRVAMRTNTTGDYNVSVGSVALYYNTTGSNNVALGTQALNNNTTASNNVAVGKDAGGLNSTGDNNTFVGKGSGYSTTSGSNTFAGHDAGLLVTSGAKNTILGRYNGNQGGLDIRTSSNNIVLADGDGNPQLHINSSGWHTQYGPLYSYSPSSSQSNITIRNSGAGADGTDYLQCRNSGNGANLIIEPDGGVKNTYNEYGAISDAKLKENILDATSQWDDLKAVQVRKYNLIGTSRTQLGVVAQELEAAGMSGLVSERADKDDEGNDLGTTTKTVKYSILYMKAVKALQEAMDRIETLEAKVTALEAN